MKMKERNDLFAKRITKTKDAYSQLVHVASVALFGHEGEGKLGYGSHDAQQNRAMGVHVMQTC